MTRKLPSAVKSWLHGWQYWLQESEAPDSYILWAGISAVAGCTRRKLNVPWVYHKYYTNHYIILVGPAGIVHKSSTIDQTRSILREIGVPTGSESQTKEELIRQMISRGDGVTSSLTVLPDELSDFIRPSGPPMLEFLTTIYGCPDVWEYSTRARGTEEMPKAFLNMLGGTTPRWIANEFDATFVEQGFASRTLFVHEMEPRFRKAKVRITSDMYKMYDLLVQDLYHISELEGTFEWKEDALDWFDDWYVNTLPKELQEVDYRLQSYVARKPTHIIKLAMVLQLIRSDDLYMTIENIQDAKHMLDNLEISMARTFSAVGRNIYANDLERMVMEIKNAGQMTYQEVVRRNNSAFMGKDSLDEALVTLEIMGYIKKHVATTGEIYYEATRN